ncbi:hypothetical protein PQR71_13975 [Paraburkholderia fungorum]|uniref:hypothetical protein n=1 Tax=Paraburkholderia fungorum TaxID=134537 RepID=UPI0038B91F67
MAQRQSVAQQFFTPTEQAALDAVASTGGPINLRTDADWQKSDSRHFFITGDTYRVRLSHLGEWDSGFKYTCLQKVSPVLRMKFAFDFDGPDYFVENVLMPAGDSDREVVRAYLFACLRNNEPFTIRAASELVSAMRNAGSGFAN